MMLLLISSEALIRIGSEVLQLQSVRWYGPVVASVMRWWRESVDVELRALQVSILRLER